MKLWIDDVRTAPEGYVWCKSVFVLFLLCCVCFGFIGCAKQPETIIEYIEVPTEVIIEKIIEVEVPIEKEIIKEIEVPVETIIEKEVIIEVPYETIIEKEVIKEVEVLVEKIIEVEIPVEVIIEKEVVKEVQVPIEVVVEKEVVKEVIVEKEIFIMPFCNFASWEEILTWQAGDKIEHLTVVNGYLVSGYEIITDYDKSGTLWQYIQYDFIYPVKLYYGCKESLSFERLGSYAVADLSGTIYSIRWETDAYGNKSCIIDFGWDHTFIELSATQWE